MADRCKNKPSEPRKQWYINTLIGYIFMETM
jgi:hypothetical protein